MFWISLLVGLSLLGCKSGAHDGKIEVTVMAATSMRNVMPELVKAFTAEHGRPNVRVGYGASGDLRKRVQDGAPADAVVMANAQPVDAMIASGHVDADSRKVIATNSLVLVGPKGASPWTFESLDKIPEGEKLAIGDPGSVPAGQYAREMLKKLGLWKALQGRVVLAGNVAAVLAYARRGEVIAAVVYQTDTRGVPDIVVLDRAKAEWGQTPQVVVGVVKDAPFARQAASFLEFVAGPKGQAILKRHGFGTP